MSVLPISLCIPDIPAARAGETFVNHRSFGKMADGKPVELFSFDSGAMQVEFISVGAGILPVRWEKMSGPLRETAGFHYQEFSSLKQSLHLEDDPFHLGDDNKVSEWVEMLIPDTAKPLAFYDHPFFGKYPAITRNQFGKGSLTYEGTVLSGKLQEAILFGVLKEAGLSGPDQNLPPSVHVKHARNRGENRHIFISTTRVHRR